MKLPGSKAMMKAATTEVRLLPIAIVAIAALLGLKGLQLAADAPGAISGVQMVLAQNEEPDQKPADAPDGGEAAPDAEAAKDGDMSAESEAVSGETVAPRRAADAINERLGDRRKTLEKFEDDLQLRENLLKATELRIEQRLQELRTLEERLNATVKEREEQEEQRFKNLVMIYQSMKPKDAARVFDRLETPVLVEVASGIDPRTMAEIISSMSAEGAERLTIALMNRAAEQSGGMKVEELPQIVGTRPAG